MEGNMAMTSALKNPNDYPLVMSSHGLEEPSIAELKRLGTDGIETTSSTTVQPVDAIPPTLSESERNTNDDTISTQLNATNSRKSKGKQRQQDEIPAAASSRSKSTSTSTNARPRSNSFSGPQTQTTPPRGRPKIQRSNSYSGNTAKLRRAAEGDNVNTPTLTSRSSSTAGTKRKHSSSSSNKTASKKSGKTASKKSQKVSRKSNNYSKTFREYASRSESHIFQAHTEDSDMEIKFAGRLTISGHTVDELKELINRRQFYVPFDPDSSYSTFNHGGDRPPVVTGDVLAPLPPPDTQCPRALLHWYIALRKPSLWGVPLETSPEAWDSRGQKLIPVRDIMRKSSGFYDPLQRDMMAQLYLIMYYRHLFHQRHNVNPKHPYHRLGGDEADNYHAPEPVVLTCTFCGQETDLGWHHVELFDRSDVGRKLKENEEIHIGMLSVLTCTNLDCTNRSATALPKKGDPPPDFFCQAYWGGAMSEGNHRVNMTKIVSSPCVFEDGIEGKEYVHPETERSKILNLDEDTVRYLRMEKYVGRLLDEYYLYCRVCGTEMPRLEAQYVQPSRLEACIKGYLCGKKLECTWPTARVKAWNTLEGWKGVEWMQDYMLSKMGRGKSTKGRKRKSRRYGGGVDDGFGGWGDAGDVGQWSYREEHRWDEGGDTEVDSDTDVDDSLTDSDGQEGWDGWNVGIEDEDADGFEHELARKKIRIEEETNVQAEDTEMNDPEPSTQDDPTSHHYKDDGDYETPRERAEDSQISPTYTQQENRDIEADIHHDAQDSIPPPDTSMAIEVTGDTVPHASGEDAQELQKSRN